MTGQTILVVDDDPSIVSVMELLLGMEDYQVLVARNGEEGVAMAKRHRPHLILMDVLMPEMNGHMATTLLKSDPDTQHIPIILVTATAQMAGNIATNTNAVYTIHKPFEPEELIQKVAQILERTSS